MPEVDDHDDNDNGIRNSFIGAFLDIFREQYTGKEGKTNRTGIYLMEITSSGQTSWEENDANRLKQKTSKEQKKYF
jgi:hypothetical protein